MRGELERAYEELRAWCRERGHAGHDPFDALNSRLFQATPLRHSRLARLVWTQAFKRSPVNLRSLDVRYSSMDDQGMANVAGMKKLERLIIRDTLVTDEGIKHLAGLTQLRELDLYGLPLTERSTPRVTMASTLRAAVSGSWTMASGWERGTRLPASS